MELMEQTTIPVGTLVRGFNYRRRFEPAFMQELVDDIKANGLIQPILVRRLPDGSNQVIAGGRRVEAFKLAFGDDQPIPALVREMTDAEATAAMISENKVRQDTTAIEDSEAAMRMLGLCNGDKVEAAKRIGWDIQFLNRRLAIMNATDKVRNAYIEDRIKLGHVELLAALRREVQDHIIDKLIQRPTMPSVEEVKAMISQVLLNLESAIFDKTDCAGCQFNTGFQQTLFETSFEGSRCTNEECYKEKTERELQARADKLTETYQVVRIVRPGENTTLVPLRAEGPRGVGQAQAAACRTCGDFGACVSAAPDKLGKTCTEICFNVACNTEKVAANEAAIKAAEVTEQSKDPQHVGSGSEVAPQETKPVVNEQAGEKPTAPVAASPTAQVSVNIRNAIREYRERVWRLILATAAQRLPVEKSRAFMLALCLFRPGQIDASRARDAVSAATGKKTKSTNPSSDSLMKMFLSMDHKELGASMQCIPACISNDMEIKSIVEFLKALDIRISDYWVVNKELFELLTKVELDAVCVELGIDQAIGKEYAKLKNGSKADFVKAALEAPGFVYKGKIPKMMAW